MAKKKVGVPGSIYRNKNRYWWKVALPGEDLPKARALKPRGAKFATTDYNVAVEVAREMWQRAMYAVDRVADEDDSITGLVQAYMRHALQYYRLSNESENIRRGMSILIEMFPTMTAEDFGPRDLKAVQQALIDRPLARTTVNKYVGMIKRMFDWAVEEERVPASVAYGLRCVSSLKRGRSAAKETKPIKPVADEHVSAVLAYATPTIAAMIELQLLTGMRSTELCLVRPRDIDTSGVVWLYTPQKHKTEHLGRERVIAIGPRGQGILRPYLDRRVDAYCFCPAESTQQMRDRRREERKTPKHQGNRPGTNRKERPELSPGQHYTKDTYGRAVRRAIKAAQRDNSKIPSWTPLQLRHSAGTRIREEFGLDVASAALGHADIDTTKIYAELGRTKAIEAAKKLG